MKAIVDAIRQVLRSDPTVISLVGLDGNDEVKVYDELAKSDTQPPFVVWSILPTLAPEGAYDQSNAIVFVNVQLSCWTQETKTSWQLSDAVDEALERGDYSAAPFEFMQVRRAGFPQPLPDRDTSWFQVASTVQLKFSGPGRTE